MRCHGGLECHDRDGMSRDVMVGMGCHGRDGMLQQGHIRQRPAHKPTPIAFFILQVLYKTAWSESVGRDCAAFCAKKWV